jgi:ribosomal protein S18 acetylase RimI-like enzyme
MTNQEAGNLVGVAASAYSFDALAEIYNQARVDYIVPMPMNGKRMAEYVHNYDVNLDMSLIACTTDGEPCGLIMAGIRQDRSWVTRLGVIPQRRRSHVGRFFMDHFIARSRERGVRLAQLEVIKGNVPAFNMFLNYGFTPTREQLIIRRPPGKLMPDAELDAADVMPVPIEEIPILLESRAPDAAWTEETSSLLRAGSLAGLKVTLPSGESGWIVYQLLPFQLTHFVVSPNGSSNLYKGLIYQVHGRHVMQDTKIENLPDSHPAWNAYQALGYLETFRRIEMILPL